MKSGQERYFRSIADLLDFVSGCAGLAPSRASSIVVGCRRWTRARQTSAGQLPWIFSRATSYGNVRQGVLFATDV